MLLALKEGSCVLLILKEENIILAKSLFSK